MLNKLQLNILVLLFLQGIYMVSAQNSQVIDIRSDDFNVLMGYQGNLEGSIKYSPLKNDEANIPVTVNILITQDVIKGQPFVNAKSVELLKKIKNELK